jgi:hypothetical protein
VGLPTKAGAAAVFQARVDAVFGEGVGVVRDFTKADGLASVYAGVDYYDLEFTATVTYPRGGKPECSLTQMFTWECLLWNSQVGPSAGQIGLLSQGWRGVGDSERLAGSVRFQKSERGWRTN